MEGKLQGRAALLLRGGALGVIAAALAAEYKKEASAAMRGRDYEITIRPR